MNAHSKILADDSAPFKVRANLDSPITCFAVRLEALLRVRPFISTEETRYYLNGAYVHAHPEGGAVIAATDGHRLGVRRDTEGLVNEAQIVKLPKDLKAPGKLHLGSWAVMTRTGTKFAHLSLVERIHDRDHDTAVNAIARIEDCYQRFGDVLIDGSFPDYTRIIPGESDGDVIRGFNAKYLAGFGDHIAVRGSDGLAPHIIIDHGDPEFMGVLMPMRVTASRRQDWTRNLAAVEQAA